MTAPAERRKGGRWTRFAPITAIGALFLVLLAMGAFKHLSLDELAAQHARLTAFRIRRPIACLAAYLAAYVLIVSTFAPGPSVMSVTGGFLFGPWLGAAAALSACGVGGLISFSACRTAFGDWAQRRAGRTVRDLEANFSHNAFGYLMTLRLVPIAPFALVTLAAGLARIRLSTFLLTTVVGTAPSVFIFAELGKGLDHVFQRGGRVDASLLAQPQVLIPLTALAALSLAGVAWRLWRSRRG